MCARGALKGVGLSLDLCFFFTSFSLQQQQQQQNSQFESLVFSIVRERERALNKEEFSLSRSFICAKKTKILLLLLLQPLIFYHNFLG